MAESAKPNKSKPTEVVECSECDARVAATVESSYDVFLDDPGFTIRYLFLKCPRCASAILAHQDDEDARYGQNPERWSIPIRLYPPASTRQLGVSVPEPIRNAFVEAVACFEAKAFTASAIMCRKVLEAVCVAHHAKGRGLAAQLKYLADKGEFDKRLFDWISALRVAGNEAAHDVGVTISREDAGDLLDFAEVVTEYMYTFREKYAAFQRRRSARTNKDKSGFDVDLE
jgi:hypothetical protein